MVVLIDPFTSYLSGIVRKYCNDNDIEIVEGVSEYLCGAIGGVPETLRAPKLGDEEVWCIQRGLIPEKDSEDEEDDQDSVPNVDDICIISESDAGVAVAERIQSTIGARGNGISPQLRNKFEQNARVARAGLTANKQILTADWLEAEDFIDNLEATQCVVKPNRGIASENVSLCCTKQEAKAAFDAIIGKPQYGDRVLNDAVLIQEHTKGNEEYAVDTITVDGITKVFALWKYDKKQVNGKAFIYQCSELVDVEVEDTEMSMTRKLVCDYAAQCLACQDFQWGPCHIEVKIDESTKELKLMEINPRWHAQNTALITQQCLGNDACVLSIQSFFEKEMFLSSQPELPKKMQGSGRIVHLIQRQKGIVEKINFESEIASLPSVQNYLLEYNIGDEVKETVDHRTHGGYIILAHEDKEQVDKDYVKIIEEYQDDIYELVGVEKDIDIPQRIERGEEREGAMHEAEKQEDKEENEEQEAEEEETLRPRPLPRYPSSSSEVLPYRDYGRPEEEEEVESGFLGKLNAMKDTLTDSFDDASDYLDDQFHRVKTYVTDIHSRGLSSHIKIASGTRMESVLKKLQVVLRRSIIVSSVFAIIIVAFIELLPYKKWYIKTPIDETYAEPLPPVTEEYIMSVHENYY